MRRSAASVVGDAGGLVAVVVDASGAKPAIAESLGPAPSSSLLDCFAVATNAAEISAGVSPFDVRKACCAFPGVPLTFGWDKKLMPSLTKAGLVAAPTNPSVSFGFGVNDMGGFDDPFSIFRARRCQSTTLQTHHRL